MQTADAKPMTSNVELLPLPEKLDFFLDGTGRQEAYNLTRDYARANVEANTEALRAEVERLEIVGRLHSGAADLAINAVRAAEARAERLAEALDAVVTFAVCYQLSEGDQCVVDARALLHPTAAQEGSHE